MTTKQRFPESANPLIEAHGDGITVTITDDSKVDTPGGGVSTDPLSFTVKCLPPAPHTTRTLEGTRVETGDSVIAIDRLDSAITFEPAAEMKATLSDGCQFTVVENDIRAGSYRLRLKGGSPS